LKQAKVAEGFFGMLMQPPNDDQELAKIAPILHAVEAGRPLREVTLDLEPETRFFILGLSPNAARLSVRYFLESTLGELASRVVQHWRDLRIEPHFWKAPPALWRLLLETAAQRDSSNVSPFLAAEFSRSILTGTAYPRPLLALTLLRIRADGVVNDLRAALAKAFLVRAQEDVPAQRNQPRLPPGTIVRAA
jgi:CRISPR-associated protein Csd1